MANLFYDRVLVAVSGAPGTGTISLGSPIAGFQSFSAGGASNGDTFSYLLLDGTNWECGIGTYNSSGPTVSRTTVTQSSAGGTTKINATSSATVMSTVRAADFDGFGSGGGGLSAKSWWRTRFPQNYPGATGVGVSDVQYKNGATLLSTGGTASASGTTGGTYSAASAFDGSTASGHGWYYNSNPDAINSWLAYNFSAPVLPTTVSCAPLNGYATTFWPQQIALDYSDDGIAWIEACVFVTAGGADNTVQTFTVP